MGEYFHELLPQLPYPAIAAFFALVSMLLANIGLADILSLSVPVLNAIYPIAIVLIVVEFLPGAVPALQWSGGWAILLGGLAEHPRRPAAWAPSPHLTNALPLGGLGFGWLLPAAHRHRSRPPENPERSCRTALCGSFFRFKELTYCEQLA